MSNYSQLMQEYLNAAAPTRPVPSRTSEAPTIPTAEDLYIAAAGGSNDGSGMSTDDQVQIDLRTLNPFQLQQKYGYDVAAQLLSNYSKAQSDYAFDRTTGRTQQEAFQDIAVQGARGITNTAGGLIGLAAGLVNDDAGVAVADVTQSVGEFITKGESEASKLRQQAYRARNASDEIDNQHQYEVDKHTSGKVTAFLRKVGRDAMDVGNNILEDGMVTSSVVSEGIGSLLTGAPVIKGAKLAGNATLKLLQHGGVIKSASVASKATKIIGAASPSVGIAAMEAGGAHSQTANEVMAMSHDQLMANSPDYVSLIEKGADPIEAKTEIANSAGLVAAAITAPTAAAAGALVRKFEGNPIKSAFTQSAFRNVLSETAEETIEGAGSQIATNVAIRNSADVTRDIADGVGEQIAAGAIGGLGSAGVVQAPGAAAQVGMFGVRKTAQGVKKAAGGLTDFILQRGEEIIKRNEAASPISDENVAAQVQAASSLMDDLRATAANEDDEESAAAKAELETLFSKVAFDPADLGEDAPETIRSALSESRDSFDAMLKLSDLVSKMEKGSEDQVTAARMLADLYERNKGALENTDYTEISQLPEENKLRQVYNSIETALSNIRDNSTVQAAIQKTGEVFKAATASVTGGISSLLAPDEKQIGTPEGKQTALNIIGVAEHSPENSDPEQIDKILEHATNGRLNLTPHQEKVLLAASALVQQRRAFLADKEANGLQKATDLVTEEAITLKGEKQKAPSLAEHARRIVSAYRDGDMEVAKARLEHLLRFAKHYQNKLAGLNQHYETGNGNFNEAPEFEALNPRTNKFEPSKAPGVNAKSASSVALAQSVAAEARLIGETANKMVEIFPELGLAPVELTQLNEGLNGPVQDVVERARTGTGTEQKPKPKTAENQLSAKSEPARKGKSGNDNSEGIGGQLELDLEGRQDTPTPPQSRVTPERAQAASDNGLNTAIQRYQDKVAEGKNTPEDDATFAVLDEEMNRREDAAYAAALAEEATQTETVTDSVTPPNPASEVQTKTEETSVDEKPAERKTQAQDEAVKEPEQTTSEANTVATTSPDVVPDFDSLEYQYQNLVGVKPGSRFINYFVKAFRKPKRMISRLLSSFEPVDDLRSIISSPDEFAARTGDSKNAALLTPDVISAYDEYLDNVPDMVAMLNKRLQAALSKRSGSESFDRLTRFVNGRAFNLVEENNGKFQFNQQLAETASIAALQWLMIARNFLGERDASAMAGIIGLDPKDKNSHRLVVLNEDALSPHFSKGLTQVEATRSLANMIRQYWGLEADPSAPIGHTEGIPEAMAKELLGSLTQIGVIEVIEPVKTVFGKSPFPDHRSPYILVPSRVEEDNPRRKFQDAIERAVLTKPKAKQHIGTPPADVPRTQHNNSKTELTQTQKKAIRSRQSVAYKLNLPFLEMLKSLSLAGILDAFGSGDIGDLSQFNEQHWRTLNGRNVTIQTAYEDMVDLVDNMRAYAEANDLPLHEVPAYFEYTFNRMNRMQMLGSSNPQASKLMREVLLPTRSKVDLSKPTSKHFTAFMLALGQHIGVKVELFSHAEALAQTQAKLDEMAGPVTDLMIWLQNPEGSRGDLPATLMADLKAKLGGDMGFGAVHALMEYARFMNADQSQRAAFETALYLEADGKTNGPANALGIFTPGPYSQSWLHNMIRAGLKFGGETTALADNGIRELGDLYQASADKLSYKMAELRNYLATNESLADVLEQSDHLNTLMDLTLGKDVTFDGETLTFTRGVTKNPLTITIYGSSVGGIAGNVASAMVTAIYEKMTAALQAQKENPSVNIADAMFPGDPEANAKLGKLEQAFYALTQREVFAADGQFFIEGPEKLRDMDLDPKSFAIAPHQLEKLENNVETLFVSFMDEAIQETLGNELTTVAKDIQRSIQTQSIVLQYAFRRAIEQRIAEKQAKDPNYDKRDFLSKDELNEIFDSLKPLAPIVETGEQNFYIANSERADTANIEFSQTLDGKMGTPGFVEGPSNAGVAGIPAMIIGSGDGFMMTAYAALTGNADRTLDVYDGMNMPLDMIEEFSQKANQAVLMSWQRNPLQALADAYTEFAKNAPLDKANYEELAELDRSLNDAGARSKKPNASKIRARMQNLADTLQAKARNLEARKRAMARVSFSVDQMASAGAPYFHQGEFSLEGMNEEEIVSLLNKLTEEELAKIDAEAKELANIEVSPVVHELGRQHESGAYIIANDMLEKLADKLGANAWQKRLLKDMVSSLAAKGYTVVTGSKRQLRAYIEQEGLPNILVDKLYDPTREVNGLTIPDRRLIMLENTDPEILTHEVVHGATFDAVSAYYAGEDLGANGAEQIRAIQRLETLMEQFLELDLTQEDAETQKAHKDALSAILGHSRQGNPAAALNEFMAWGLTNQKLAEVQSKTKASPLAQLARNIIDGIKKLIFGSRSASPVLDDMLTNLRFNSLVLSNAQLNAGPRDLFKDTVLYHAQNYGNDDHLVQVNRALQSLVVRHLQRAVRTGNSEADNQRVYNNWRSLMALTDRVTLAVANGFSMDMQQKTTFQIVHAALMSAAELDPNMLSQAAELFAHATQTLKVEDFMDDPNDTTGVDFYYAAQQYNLVLGNYGTELDPQGRSSLLPTFLALAIVHPKMRDVLSRLPLPESQKNTLGTLDAKLENLGNSAMEKLGLMVSGQGSSAPNVQAAIDALTDHLIKVSQERKSFYERFVGPLGNSLDNLNKKATDFIQWAAEAGFEKAGEIKRSTDNKLVQVAAESTRVVAALFNQNTANTLAEGWVSLLNRSVLPEPVQKLFSDMIGRTENNAPLYDLIKKIRTWITQSRQRYREHLPELLASKFSRELNAQEWQQLFKGMGKTDLAALRDTMTSAEILELLKDPAVLQRELQKLEQDIAAAQPKAWATLQSKSKQLAEWMNTGKPSGSNPLRNSYAIADLLGETAPKGYSPEASLYQQIDKLVTLYALDGLGQDIKDTMSNLSSAEKEGISFSLAFLEGLRKAEREKEFSSMGLYNHYKGHMPTEQAVGGTLIVAGAASHAKLLGQSFTQVGVYNGSNLEQGASARGYYYSPVSTRAAYKQGLLQMVQHTVGGVDRISGLTHGRTAAGAIVDDARVSRIYRNRHRENGSEPLLPVYNLDGTISAYERSVDPVMLERVQHEEHLGKSMGIWAGRQVEERESEHVNYLVLQNMFDMWQKDTNRSAAKQREYVDLFDPDTLSKNRVWRDTINSMPGETLRQIRSVFGDNFYVRRDMLDDALGYRNASVRDVWTHNSNWSPEMLATTKKVVAGVFGNDAYRYLVKSEDVLKNVVTDAKVMIVVKSVVVPTLNLLANIYQLWGRGVPLNAIGSSFPKKMVEVNDYLRTRERKLDAEAELQATTNVLKRQKLEAEIQSIDDRHKRLSIWPLIEAGEFTSISDATVSHEDMMLSEGRLNQYFENLVNKLPNSVKTLGRYGLVTRDTALFKGMQRAVEYGDFLAKAVLYDDLVKRQGKTSDHALARITEEFVNYDRLPGRFRGYLEDVGLLWFWHFKIRSVKVALSMLRNNPVHALLSFNAPQPDLFGSIGSPLDDNLLSVALDGRLDNSIGYDMMFRAPFLNPWVNVAS